MSVSFDVDNEGVFLVKILGRTRKAPPVSRTLFLVFTPRLSECRVSFTAHLCLYDRY